MMHYQLADLFEALCDANENADVLFASGKLFSRKQLDERANKLAHYLQEQGIGAGDHVGVYSYNRAEWIEALLACWKIRASVVNINFRYVSHELRYIWEHSDMKALVYEQSFAPLVEELKPGFPALKTYLCLEEGDTPNTTNDTSYEMALSNQPATRGFAERSDDDILLIYTGGTTGMPKGVMWRHFDFYHNVVVNAATQKPEDILQYANLANKAPRNLALSPLMHGGGQFSAIIALLRGGLAAIPASKRMNPKEVLGIIESQKINLLNIIGDAMARPIANEQMQSKYDTSSLRFIYSGGALLSETAHQLLRDAFGDKVTIAVGIGGSEIGAAAQGAGSGHKTDGQQFKASAMMAVLDDDLNVIEPTETGRIGHLAMKGFIPLGYYNDPKKTAEVFKTDKHGVRWVLAGDRVKVEQDGSFTLVGRDSQCINSGGEKIYVEEVERAALLHPAIKRCAVVGVPDPVWQQRVVAVIELMPGEKLMLEELKDHCRQYIAGYKIPRDLVITEFKETPNGKVDYQWAKTQALNNMPERADK